MTEETSSDSLKTSSSSDSRMAGPDNQEPVTASSLVDSREIPVKASPPREKSPSLTDVKTSEPGAQGSSVPPPDGGWGWAVVFASFMIHIIGNNKVILYFLNFRTKLFVSQCKCDHFSS